MKRIIIVLFLALLFAGNAAAASPVDKGVYSLSGQVSYSHSSYKNGESFMFAPSLLYFVYPKLAMGASVLYYDNKTDEAEIESYGIGPTARYYFGQEAFFPFAEVSYTYHKSRSKADIGAYSSTTDSHYSNTSIGLGADYFLSKNVSLEPMVRYTRNNSSSEHTSSGSSSNGSGRTEYVFVGIGINVFIY